MPISPLPVPIRNDEVALPSESPEALFEFGIGDADVELLLLGSWTLSMFGTAGLTVRPDIGITFLDTFPDMQTGFYFNQVPDLLISLRMLERYFFDFNYTGDFSTSRFKAGYEGKENENLRHIYLGNRDIGITGYKNITLPESSYSSLGGEVLIATEQSEHEALIRYENNDQSRKVFVGMNEVTEYSVHPEDFADGRHFRLPDSGIAGAEVYVQDPLGNLAGSDGKLYRQAILDDVMIDGDEGTVWIKNEIKARVLVFYTWSGMSVGTDNGLMGVDAIVAEDIDGNIDIGGSPRRFYFNMGTVFGENMTARRITLSNGRDCLLLCEPGVFSPFEIQGSYLLSQNLPAELWKTRIVAVRKGTAIEKTDFAWTVYFQGVPLSNKISAYYNGSLRSDFRNLYPFPDPGHTIYGPSRDRTSAATNFDILVQLLQPVTDYFLEPDIIPGSVRVTRNGQEETRFQVEAGTGRLTFLTTIHPEDRIEVKYASNMNIFGNGDLVFAWGNRINLDERFSLEASTGLRWNMLPGTYTDEAFVKTGSMNGTVALSGKDKNWDFTVSASGSLSNPDTTGIFRLLGMEYSEYPVQLSQETAYPASVPSGVGGCTADNRGTAVFKDYRKYGILGDSVLMPLTWDIPDDQVFGYVDGAKPGPYEAAGGSGVFGYTSLVEDVSFEADDLWAGYQIPLARNKSVIDLSGATSISVSYRWADASKTFPVYFEVGETAEDLDADVILDNEVSPASPGFTFNDDGNGAILRVGSGPRNAGNSRLDTEDVDGNGFLDPEVPARVVSIAGPADGSSTWNTFTHSLADGEKTALTRTRAFRVVVANTGGTAGSGKLLIDRITVAGSSFWKNITSGSGDEELSVRETYEAFARIPPVRPLSATFPLVASTFHPNGEEQKVLEIDWNTFGAGESWEVVNRFLKSAGGIRYGKVNLYFRAPVLAPAAAGSFVFTLTDVNGRKISWTYDPLASDDWHEMTFEIDSRVLRIDAADTPTTASVDERFAAPVELSVAYDGGGNGLLYIDELHLSEPGLSLGASIEGAFTFDLPGDLVTIGDLPVLGDLRAAGKISYTTPGYAALYGEPSIAHMFRSVSDVSVSLLYSKIDARLDVSGTDGLVTFSPEHKITLPGDGGAFQVSDTYRTFRVQSDALAGTETVLSGSGFFRENTVAVRVLDDALTLMGAVQSFSINTTLIQNWGVTVGLHIKELADFRTDVRYSESRNGFSYVEENYFVSWIRDFSLIAPYNSGSMLEQKGDLSVTGSLLTRPVGGLLGFTIGFHDHDIVDGARSAESTLGYSLSLPVTIETGIGKSLIVTAGYRRALATHTQEIAGTGNLTEDLDVWGQSIMDNPSVFLSVPIAELFDPADEERFIAACEASDASTTLYVPELFISFSRQSGSHVYDLIVPQLATVSILKKFNREGDLYQFTNEVRAQTTSNAINIFGKFGIVPLLTFCTLDEYLISFLANLSIGESAGRSEYIIDSLFVFRGEAKEALSIGNQCKITDEKLFSFSDRCTVSFDWGVYPENGIPLPIVDSETGALGYWSNKESCSVVSSYIGGQESQHPVTIVLSHVTGITYPEKGFIQGVVSFGIDFEDAGDGLDNEFYTRLVLKAGIEAQFKW